MERHPYYLSRDSVGPSLVNMDDDSSNSVTIMEEEETSQEAIEAAATTDIEHVVDVLHRTFVLRGTDIFWVRDSIKTLAPKGVTPGSAKWDRAKRQFRFTYAESVRAGEFKAIASMCCLIAKVRSANMKNRRRATIEERKREISAKARDTRASKRAQLEETLRANDEQQQVEYCRRTMSLLLERWDAWKTSHVGDMVAQSKTFWLNSGDPVCSNCGNNMMKQYGPMVERGEFNFIKCETCPFCQHPFL